MSIDGTEEVTEVSDSAGSVEAVVIPRNIAFRLQTDIGRFLYENLDLRNIHGEVDVEDGILSIRQARADLLEGSTQLSGSYNTQNPEAPKTDFSFQASKINIRQAFETFNTVQILAPIAAFVEGEFRSEERRVGKESRSRRAPDRGKERKRTKGATRDHHDRIKTE